MPAQQYTAGREGGGGDGAVRLMTNLKGSKLVVTARLGAAQDCSTFKGSHSQGSAIWSPSQADIFWLLVVVVLARSCRYGVAAMQGWPSDMVGNWLCPFSLDAALSWESAVGAVKFPEVSSSLSIS